MQPPVIFKTSDGHPIVYIFRGLLGNLLEGVTTSQVLGRVTQACAELDSSSPPQAPVGKAYEAYLMYQRHKPVCDAKGWPCGVRHLGLWSGTGQPDLNDSLRALDDPSADPEARALAQFYTEVAPVLQGLEMHISALDPEAYDADRQLFDPVPDDRVSKNRHWAWSTLSTLVNVRPTVQYKLFESLQGSGWVAMTSFGNWTGGDLVLPECKRRVDFKPSDVCFFRADLVTTSFLPFEGQMTTLVFHTPERHLSIQDE